MRWLLVLSGLVAVLAGCGRTAEVNPFEAEPEERVAAPEVTPREQDAFIEGNNALAAALYAKVKEAEPGNFFHSPTSLAAALALVYPGARGKTAEEIAGVLAVKLPGERLIEAGAWFRHEFAKRNRAGIEIKLASALWGQQDQEWRPEYLEVLKTKFGAQLRKADFQKQPDRARQLVNQWAAFQTNDKIQDYIPAGQFSDSTRFVLANALYFKGDWAGPFPENDTYPEKFQRQREDAVDAPMMHGRGRFGYRELPGAQILEIAYKGHELGFVVVLPEKKDGLAELEKGLTAARLADWLQNLGPAGEVIVTFPKFKVASNLDLTVLLPQLGMTTAFSTLADLSGMAGRPGDLFIRNGAQKTFLEVKEKGTEAAAVTHFEIKKTEAKGQPPPPPPPKVFRADHPFLFLIRDRKHNTVLFLGRVVDPMQ